jgi:protein translocase SecG subunit
MFTLILSLIIFLSITMTLIILSQKPTSMGNPGAYSSNSSQKSLRVKMDILEHTIWALMGTIFILSIISSFVLKNTMKPQSAKIAKTYDMEIEEESKNGDEGTSTPNG